MQNLTIYNYSPNRIISYYNIIMVNTFHILQKNALHVVYFSDFIVNLFS